MIRVKIDLVPFGIGAPKELGEIRISNTGTGTPTQGNYLVYLYDKAGRLYRSGTIKNFPRKKLLAFDLLLRGLQDTIGERNK